MSIRRGPGEERERERERASEGERWKMVGVSLAQSGESEV